MPQYNTDGARTFPENLITSRYKPTVVNGRCDSDLCWRSRYLFILGTNEDKNFKCGAYVEIV